MDFWLYASYSVAYVVMLIAWLRWRQPLSIGWMAVLLNLVGLLYDNVVLALGGLVNHSALLEAASYPRFWLHALVTPLLCWWAWEKAHQARLRWAENKPLMWGWIAGTAGLVLLGASHLTQLHLVATTVNGIHRYAQPVASPFAAVVMVVALMVVGGWLWRQRSWPWLFVGAFVAFVVSGVAGALKWLAFGSGGEVVLLACVVLTDRRLMHWATNQTVAMQHTKTPEFAANDAI